MLAVRGDKPFDRDGWLFEIKWDGTRTIAHCGSDLLLHNRRLVSVEDKYPELRWLEELPEDTVLDGEVVVLVSGRPDFQALLQRAQGSPGDPAERAARELPVTYVAFDLLRHEGNDLTGRSLAERRAALVALGREFPRLQISEGVEGRGEDFFAGVRAEGLEGMVAKDLRSTYVPGARSDSWRKIKQRHKMPCALIGYQSTGEGLSILLGAPDSDGRLHYVGRVGSGWTESQAEDLHRLFAEHHTEHPWLETGMEATWLEPGLYCLVSYGERTRSGRLRAPVFLALLAGETEPH